MPEKSPLRLVESESFGSTNCDVYQSESGEFLFTREQIGSALEYENPRNAIAKIHSKHADRLDKFSIKVSVTNDRVEGGAVLAPPSSHPDASESVDSRRSNGGDQMTTLYTRKGVMEICRWSRQPKANAFMDFVWDLTDRLMRHEVSVVPSDPGSGVVSAEINQALGEISAKMESMMSAFRDVSGDIVAVKDRVGALEPKFSAMESKFSALESKVSNMDSAVKKVRTNTEYSNYYLRTQLRSGYDRNWESGAVRRVNKIAEFIGKDSKQLLRSVYREMESRYGIELQSFSDDYKRVKKVSTCSTLSVISFSFTLREMFDAVVDEVSGICGLAQKPERRSELLDMAHEAAMRVEQEYDDWQRAEEEAEQAGYDY